MSKLDGEYIADYRNGELYEVKESIVRCRDCKYNAEGACEWWDYCDIDDHPNGYCAWGERRPE